MAGDGRETTVRLRARTVALIAAGVAAVAVARHLRGAAGRAAAGGIVVGDAWIYDALAHRLVLGSLLDRVAADVGTVVPHAARVLEVGCGPGRLSIRLARRHGLDVTGLDLDPAMIERARANAGRLDGAAGRAPTFLVGDVASLAFGDRSFDLVVSTLSMHHWADPAAGLVEIGRVLRPGGRALVWDLRPGIVPFHRHVPDPTGAIRASGLRVASAAPWPWPGRLRLLERLELVRDER
jgi:SAM-dependent methyltransferase